MSRARTPPVYTDVTRFAVRRPGHPGWVMVETIHDAETLPRHLPELGLSPDECRRVLTYITPKRVARPLWLAGDDAYVFMMGSGWCFDARAACWRAPEEAVTEPPGRPPEVEALRIAFGTPDIGWLDVTCEAAEQRFDFAVSAVFDPFEDLARWLEALLDGRTPRLMIDVEGDEVEWHTFAAERDRVRLVIAVASDGGVEAGIKLDVVLPRPVLIRAVYTPLLGLWYDNVAPGDWLDGAAPRDPSKPERDPEEEGAYDFLPFRSVRIEAALGLLERHP